MWPLLASLMAAGGDDDWQRGYRIGDAVELKVTDAIWQSCVVSENPPGGLMRVRCVEYVEPAPGNYRRAQGTYIVYGKGELRPAGGGAASTVTPPVAPVSPPPAGAASAAPTNRGPQAAPGNSGDGLRIGEYACYGSGGRILGGFGFKALPGNRYTDLDGGESGSYRVDGDSVSFSGGHLDGTVGRALNNGNFRIGQQADCEPY